MIVREELFLSPEEGKEMRERFIFIQGSYSLGHVNAVADWRSYDCISVGDLEPKCMAGALTDASDQAVRGSIP